MPSYSKLLASLRKNFEVTVTKQQNKIEGLTVGLEKVSAQVGVSALGVKIIAIEEPTGESRNDKYESTD